MRKIAIWIMITILVFSFIPTCSMASTTTVYCNGNPLWFSDGPYIIDGQTFIPVTGLSSAFGFTYHWDAAASTVSLYSQYVNAWIQAGNPNMSVSKNGYLYTTSLTATPRIINGKFFVPVRTIAEIFGYSVAWNPVIGCASINSISYTSGNIEASDIYMTGFTPPTTITIGYPYVLSGSICSSYGINRVNVKVIDAATGIIEVNETDFDINRAQYSLSSIDTRIRFGLLSKGNKTLQITAVNCFEGRRVYNFLFNINQPIQPQNSTLPATNVSGGQMLWPVPSSGLLTTIFWCDNPACHSNAGRANGHAALDIAANEGADVIAVMDGVVEMQGFGNSENHKSGYGNFILLDHGNGLKTQYSHLYSIYVTDGQRVSAGQVIGGVGNTGNSTGNHLDFYISQNGVKVDPLYYLTLHPNIRCWEECDLPYFNAALRARGILQ